MMTDTGLPMHINEDDHNAAKRLLKRLRIALVIWFIVFVITMIWFTISALS
jgi:hypothetical protein